jgi:hypothetical protein
MQAAKRSMAGFEGGMFVYSWDAPKQVMLYVTNADGEVRHEFELTELEAERIRRAINIVIVSRT